MAEKLTSSWKELYQDYPKFSGWHLAAHLRNDYPLLHWIMALEPASVLEVGAGTGKGSVLVKRLLPTARVVATDLDAEICEGIRRFAAAEGSDIEVAQCDTLVLPYSDKSFDVCFSVGLLEHFSQDDLLRALLEQLRVARAVILEVPTLLWFLQHRSSQGDELKLPKVEWLFRIGKAGTILDFACVGPLLEEILLLVVLTKDPSVKLHVSPNFWLEALR